MTFDPATALYEVYATFGDGSFGQGTGWAVSPNAIVTAGHAVNKAGAPAKTLQVRYQGSYIPVAGCRSFPMMGLGDSESLSVAAGDYAVIALAAPFTAPRWFGMLPDAPSQRSACTAGFPDDIFTAASFPVTVDIGTPEIWDTGAALVPGASGSPIWITAASGVQAAIGIYVLSNAGLGTGNAVRLTSDHLAQIESWITELTGQAPCLARLYAGVLGRWPEAGGWASWTTLYVQVAAGLGSNPPPAAVLMAPLPDGGCPSIAAGFTRSPEFLATFGGLSNTDFVAHLYQSVLGRTPDAAASAWVAALDGGASRDVVALGFTESPEAIGNMGAFGQGLRSR